MSQKITSKNLSYDQSASLPPFLAKLRAEAGGARGPDPLLAAQKRTVKKRSSSEEAEDAPLVVDEEGNAVNVEVEKDGTVKAQGDEAKEEDKSPENVEKREDSSKTSFGARKRKVGKVVGDVADDAIKSVKPVKVDGGKDASAADKKVKKKSKKIKLSFDEEGG